MSLNPKNCYYNIRKYYVKFRNQKLKIKPEEVENVLKTNTYIINGVEIPVKLIEITRTVEVKYTKRKLN